MKSSLSSTWDYIKYVINMVGYVFKAMYYLATSKVCVTESYCVPISILKHKKELKVIQIWHSSGAVKKFGYQALNTKKFLSSERNFFISIR
jgi:CDP-ribitol ribitolphosphotransferase